MNQPCTMKTNSAGATEKVAEDIGRRLRGGEVIELVSDLGGGKTTFVRGLARGVGSPDRVASPTFTISKLYTSDPLELHHFDFYRLTDAGLLQHELHDVMASRHAVLVVEWGDIVHHVLPAKRLTIRITQTGDDSRELVFSCPKGLSYLVENIC